MLMSRSFPTGCLTYDNGLVLQLTLLVAYTEEPRLSWLPTDHLVF